MDSREQLQQQNLSQSSTQGINALLKNSSKKNNIVSTVRPLFGNSKRSRKNKVQLTREERLSRKKERNRRSARAYRQKQKEKFTLQEAKTKEQEVKIKELQHENLNLQTRNTFLENRIQLQENTIALQRDTIDQLIIERVEPNPHTLFGRFGDGDEVLTPPAHAAHELDQMFPLTPPISFNVRNS